MKKIPFVDLQNSLATNFYNYNHSICLKTLIRFFNYIIFHRRFDIEKTMQRRLLLDMRRAREGSTANCCRVWPKSGFSTFNRDCGVVLAKSSSIIQSNSVFQEIFARALSKFTRKDTFFEYFLNQEATKNCHFFRVDLQYTRKWNYLQSRNDNHTQG